MIYDRARLRETLGDPRLAWLVARVRERVERGRPLTGVVSLAAPSAPQREALDRLLGRRPSRGRALTVALPLLRARLEAAGICDDLEDVARALGGAIVDRQAAARQRAASWEEMTARVAARAARQPELLLDRWWARLRAQGLLGRLAGGDLGQADALVRSVFRVLDALPAEGAPLPELAAATLGDSHALDRGQPVGTLVLRLLAGSTAPIEAAPGAGGAPDAATAPPISASRRHELWSRVGVDSDALASSVLALNLPAVDAGLTGASLARHAALGEPIRLTGRQLHRHPPDLAPVRGRTVFVCENPAVVAAAAHRLGPRCAPVLCTEGQPRVPFHVLASRVVAAGGTLRVRADFDWTGVGIVAGLLDRHGDAAQPWRMGRQDYLALPAGPALRADRRRDTPWDAPLSPAMVARGAAAHEEGMLASLLEDLAPP